MSCEPQAIVNANAGKNRIPAITWIIVGSSLLLTNEMPRRLVFCSIPCGLATRIPQKFSPIPGPNPIDSSTQIYSANPHNAGVVRVAMHVESLVEELAGFVAFCC